MLLTGSHLNTLVELCKTGHFTFSIQSCPIFLAKFAKWTRVPIWWPKYCWFESCPVITVFRTENVLFLCWLLNVFHHNFFAQRMGKKISIFLNFICIGETLVLQRVLALCEYHYCGFSKKSINLPYANLCLMLMQFF